MISGIIGLVRPVGALSSIRGALWATDALRPVQILTIAEALQEIALVALDASEGRRALEPSDRRSFACDIGLAIAHIGPALRTELGHDLQSVKKAVADGKAVLSDGQLSHRLYEQTLDLLTPIRVREHVLARVEVTGARALTPPAAIRGSNVTEWARRFVSDIISAATFRFGGSRWRLLDGARVFTASGDWHGSGFHDPRERAAAREWSKQSTDPTAEALNGIDASALGDLAEHKPPVYHSVEEARWHHGATAAADIAQRVALRIRGFERVPPAAPSQAWQDTLFSYLSGDWAMDHVGRHLVSAGFALRNAVEFPWLNDPSAILTNADQAIYSSSGARYEVNTQAVMQHAEAVAAEFSARSWERRMFREVVRRTRTGDDLRRWLIDIQEICRILIARSARQRNSVVHGRLVSVAVLGSIDEFLELMSGILVATSVDVLAGSLQGRLELARNRYAARLALLNGASTADPFFAPIE